MNEGSMGHASSVREQTTSACPRGDMTGREKLMHSRERERLQHEMNLRTMRGTEQRCSHYRRHKARGEHKREKDSEQHSWQRSRTAESDVLAAPACVMRESSGFPSPFHDCHLPLWATADHLRPIAPKQHLPQGPDPIIRHNNPTFRFGPNLPFVEPRETIQQESKKTTSTGTV